VVDLRSTVPEEWQPLINREGFFTTLTSLHAGMDCFFAAVLQRNSE
jgi:hypothetical protein